MLHSLTSPIHQTGHYIFFIGGYDLEMVEIRNMLQSHGCAFFDKKLSWGAKASDYKEELATLPKKKYLS